MRHLLPVLALLAGLGSSISFAQVEIVDCIGQKTLFVSELQGKVLDPSGVSISYADDSLLRDGNLLRETRTDARGKFRFRGAMGWYTVLVKSPGFSDTSFPIRSGPDVRATFHSNEIKVILGVGMNAPCPSATTSNKDAQKNIRAYSEKLKGKELDHATQK